MHGLLSDSEKLSVARMQWHGEVGMDKWGERRKITDAKASGSRGQGQVERNLPVQVGNREV